jgi:hypothetical protein
MLRYLKWVFHPAVLIVVSMLLIGTAGLVFLPLERNGGLPAPMPVQRGEQEIAWLYPATSTTTWERLATAVRMAKEHLEAQFPGLTWEHDQDGGTNTRATPQITLTWPHGQGRLVFRWYKLTSQMGPQEWVQALLARRPRPLAIIGGNNSYWARELASHLERATENIPKADRPLLLLTTATADRVQRSSSESEPGLSLSHWRDDSRTVPLTSLYADRTYRFCFSNRQMATGVTRFIWSRPELRPDSDPAYLVQWTDDSYSQDFFDGSLRVLDYRAADNGLQQWAYLVGSMGLRVHPAMLAGWFTSGFRHEGGFPLDIDSSVGSFAAPNPFEAKAVRDLLKQMVPDQVELRRPLPRRPLLVLTGQQQPSRRFLRDLARSAPGLARRFVVAMGDAISFNTIYRDRQVTWPIQDLPFTLVFFAHRNPIDPGAGFRPVNEGTSERRTGTSGSEDVLLFRDIIEACALASQGGSARSDTPDAFADVLQTIGLVGDRLLIAPNATPLFGARGQRNSGTGEHIVWVRPHFEGNQVLPRATIEVWARQAPEVWQRVGQPLTVSYDEFEVLHGDRPTPN